MQPYANVQQLQLSISSTERSHRPRPFFLSLSLSIVTDHSIVNSMIVHRYSDDFIKAFKSNSTCT